LLPYTTLFRSPADQRRQTGLDDGQADDERERDDRHEQRQGFADAAAEHGPVERHGWGGLYLPVSMRIASRAISIMSVKVRSLSSEVVASPVRTWSETVALVRARPPLSAATPYRPAASTSP